MFTINCIPTYKDSKDIRESNISNKQNGIYITFQFTKVIKWTKYCRYTHIVA